MRNPESVAKMRATTLERFPDGIQKSAEGVAKIRAAARKRMRSSMNPMKDPEIARRVHSRCLHRSEKSKTEEWFESIAAAAKLPILFTGNGSCWIARRNPDFVAIGQKAAIEVTQDMVFNSVEAIPRTLGGYATKTIAHYLEHGWRCLVVFLPCHRGKAPRGLVETVRSFLESGGSLAWRCGESFQFGESTGALASST